MDYVEAERLIKSHECARCGGELSYRYLGAGECEVICPGNPGHKEFRPRTSLTQRWQRGEPLPLHIKQNLDKKYGGDPVKKRQSLALKKVDDLVPDLEQMWPELVKKGRNIALQMAEIAILHGLDPYTGEIMLYQGQITIAHKAKMRKVYDTGKLESLETREATDEEFKERGWTKEDTKHGWVAMLEREGLKKPIKGYGRVTWKEYRYAESKEAEKARERGEERPTFLWLLREPADMAEKRAIDDALRKGFPDSIVLTLPGIETIVGEFTEIKGEGASEESPGEEKSSSSSSSSSSSPPPPPPSSQPSSHPTGRDPNSIKTLRELNFACWTDFGMQPREVVKEAGYSNPEDIKDFAGAYIKIRNKKGGPDKEK